MAYLSGRPNATDSLPQAQTIIKENFGQLETQFSVDHDSLLVDDASGKHLKVTLPEQSSDPSTAADEGALYTKDSGTQTELYFREESDGDVVQMTKNGVVNTPIQAMVAYDSAGVIVGNAINVSSVTANGSGSYTINFTNALADANYTAIAQVGSALDGYPYIDSKNAADCTVKNSRNTNRAGNVVILRV